MKISRDTQNILHRAIQAKVDCAVPDHNNDGGDLNRHVGAVFDVWVSSFHPGEHERMKSAFDDVYTELKLLGLSW